MIRKVMIPLDGNDVAPRFDLAAEVWMGEISRDGKVLQERTMILPQASDEELCHLVLTEKINTVICGGIEEEYYQYLRWKHVEVFDSVIGPYARAMEAYLSGTLESGAILFERFEVK